MIESPETVCGVMVTDPEPSTLALNDCIQLILAAVFPIPMEGGPLIVQLAVLVNFETSSSLKKIDTKEKKRPLVKS